MTTQKLNFAEIKKNKKNMKRILKCMHVQIIQLPFPAIQTNFLKKKHYKIAALYQLGAHSFTQFGFRLR